MKKKILFCFMIAALCLSSMGCGSTATTESADNESSTQMTVEDVETTTEDEGSSTSDSAELNTCWEKDFYVDEFDEPTDDWYIRGTNDTGAVTNAKFSNSATSNSELLVQILVDSEEVTIFLYEYGSNQLKNSSSYSDDTFSITLRSASGEESSFKGTLYGNGGDRIYLNKAGRKAIKKALKGDEAFKLYIVEDDMQTSTYLFSVEPSNFGELYKEAKNQ